MQEKKIFKLNKYGKIHAVFDLSNQDRDTLLVFIPGYTARKEWLFYSYMARKLSGSGYNVLRFDLPGHGKSDGIKQDSTINDIVNITKLILCEIRNDKNFKFKKFVLAGHSYGGTIAMMVSAGIDFVSGVIAISATLDWKKMISNLIERNRIKKLGRHVYFVQLGGLFWRKCNPALLEYSKLFQVDSWIDKIKAPTFLISGTNDRTVLTYLVEETYLKLKSKKDFVKINGAMHWFSFPYHRKELINKIVAWLNHLS